MTHRLFHAVAVLSLLVSTAPCAAQDALTTLVGRVVDAETGQPVALATAEVIGARTRVVTDADGFFRMPGLDVRNVRLLIRRIGYVPLRVTLNLETDPAAGLSDTTVLSDPLPLQPHPVELEELNVEASDPWIERKFHNKGLYYRSRLATRRDIEKMPHHMAGLLRRTAGPPKLQCSFDFYVDGRSIPRFLVPQLVALREPIEFEAIEVYYSVNRMGAGRLGFGPTSRVKRKVPRLGTLMTSPDLPGVPCGVIRLWSNAEAQPRTPALVVDPEVSRLLPTGTGEVRGRIMDDRREPVGGVIMILVDYAGVEIVRGTTDRDGRYALRAPAPGSYRLRSMQTGYSDWTSRMFTLAEGGILDFTPQ